MITPKPYWSPYHYLHHATLPLFLRRWLLDSGSFMQRLKQHGIKNAQIKVLRQDWQLPKVDECKQLHLRPRRVALVREVLIFSEGKKWMVARTVFPKETLTGKLKQLAYLKNRSLGSVLFKDPALKRSQFTIACIKIGMDAHQKIMHQAHATMDEYWGRRSLFQLGEKKILLTAFFLPESFKSL